MEYVSIKQISEKWGICARRVQTLCTEGRIEGAQRPGLHRGCRGHRHELCDSVEQHPAGTSTAAAPLCGTGRRKALRLLQRGTLQHRKRTDDRGAVSGQTGTSRFKDLVLR